MHYSLHCRRHIASLSSYHKRHGIRCVPVVCRPDTNASESPDGHKLHKHSMPTLNHMAVQDEQGTQYLVCKHTLCLLSVVQASPQMWKHTSDFVFAFAVPNPTVPNHPPYTQASNEEGGAYCCDPGKVHAAGSVSAASISGQRQYDADHGRCSAPGMISNYPYMRMDILITL